MRLKRGKEPHRLQRLFFFFPGQWPGLGLLLLRAAVGVIALLQGGAYFQDRGESPFGGIALGLTTAASGLLLVTGLLTPLSSALIAVSVLGTALSWFPAPVADLFSTPVSWILTFIVSLSLVFLGPGAYSVDSRLFGRREIIIPDVPRSFPS